MLRGSRRLHAGLDGRDGSLASLAAFFRGENLCEVGIVVAGRARFDIDLFNRGGLAILDAIRRQGYDVLYQRPTVSKFGKFRLLGGALVRGVFG